MAELIFSLLGQLQVRHRQLGAISLKNRKAIGLLAYLLSESEQMHSREFLLALLWPDMPTAAAQNNLRVTWAQLQKALGANSSEGESPLIADRLSLGFNPHSDHELDVTRFRSLIEASRNHQHHEQQACAECTLRLSEAVSLVRGDFLGDFLLGNCLEFDNWLLAKRQAFRAELIWALEQLAFLYERAGQVPDAERTLRRLIAYDSLNETAYRQLMRVLAQADQRSAALELYNTFRRTLASELGLAPAIETMTLAEQIRGQAQLESRSTLNELPPVMTRFFGRKEESARLIDLLSRRTVRLVTLTGAGGVGKTRLSIELAHQMLGVFAHDICFVELAGVGEESAVEDAVASALRLPSNTGHSSITAIVDFLRDKTLLLVLDNCEHLVKACSRLVHNLCHDVGGLTVLATSRVPLQLEEEHVIRLETFASPTIHEGQELSAADSLNFYAIQLFADRAAQAMLPFKLTDANVHAVVRICQQLDGIPLAIEIAAAQVRVMPIEAIAERLGQRFTWLNRQSPENMSRQRTLHTLIDWSYGLLSAQARSLFERLAVFAGGWTLEAAEAVNGSAESCAELLAHLVEHSLVTFGNDAERMRYSIHETIRQFAYTQLRGSEQEADAMERHARYYAKLVADAAENHEGLSLPKRLKAVKDEHDNLGRAFECLMAHDREKALALVAQLGTELKFWELGGFFQEGRRWLQRSLDGTEGMDSIHRAQALLAAAELSSAISDFDYGLQCCREARDLFQKLGETRGEIDARLTFCELADLAGENDDLQAQAEELLQMAEAISYPAGIAKANLILGTIAYFHRNENQATIQYVLPSIAIWRKLVRPFELATALNRLAGALNGTKDYVAGEAAFEECRDIYQSLGYRRGVATATQNLGVNAIRFGDYARARALFCEGLRIRRELGLQRGYAYSFEYIAELNMHEKRYEQAVQLFAAAQALRIQLGAPIELANQIENDDSMQDLRAQLGETLFELAWAKGAAMSTEQAITLALS